MEEKKILGNLHSIETMGTLDGPGNRTIFFLKGCPLRCLYCHNPDTQSTASLKQISPEEVLNTALRYKPYHGQEGGVTFSGGEPLLQGAFLHQALKLLKENGFNTCIDTSGIGDKEYYKKIMPLVDTLILDVKAFDAKSFRDICRGNFKSFQRFISKLKDYGFAGQIWIRHVMLPGYTDNKGAMEKLIEVIEPIKNFVERIEILPYHTNGVAKYEQMGLEYQLKGLEPMDPKKAKDLEIYANKVFSQALKRSQEIVENRQKEKLKEFSEREIKVDEDQEALYQRFKNFSLIAGLDSEVKREILGNIKLFQIKTDQFVFKSGDRANYMYIVVKGRVKIYQYTLDGKEQIFYIYREGDYIGGLNLMDYTSYLYTGRAIQDSEVVAIPRDIFMKHIYTSPVALQQMLKKSFERIRWAEELIERLAVTNATMKTAGLLTRLSREIGVKTKEGIKLELALNREELGSYTGLTRESITRKLGEFKDLGYIDLIGNRVVLIKDLEALENMAF
ncbi:MAG: pyruvate formate-lyase-activating protein [Bacillota bacterium]|nr:pyruvate formate-lyase-activating protein [Bacillota bacterium]